MTPFNTMITFLLASSTVAVAAFQPLPGCPLPAQLISNLRTDPSSLSSAAVDYGNIVHVKPLAVMSPSSAEDISLLITASYNCRLPYGVAARGNGHSTRGQSMVSDGVVLDMRSLDDAFSIRVVKEVGRVWFADVAGGSLWIDVLNATLKEGVVPVTTWTDVLTLTVGGTLSNAGIGGEAFRLGPQIVNVLELDVVTGKGEMMTCSASNNPELFNGVLGGLGQFGVITRARLALAPAPQRVKWAQLLYTNFADFTKDQESIISNNGRGQPNGVDYLEGQLLLDNGIPKTEFFPIEAQPKIESLVKQNGIVYALELALYYDDNNELFKDKQLKQLVEGLKYNCGFVFIKDVSYREFISRGHIQYPNEQAHPWLNLFVPKSKISEFCSGVLTGIILQRNISTGPVLLYPMNRNKWDEKMSAVFPDDDVFYSFGLLSKTEVDNWQKYLEQNADVLQYCEKAGIKVKQYIPNISNQQEWIRHFGSRWDAFRRRKEEFDPKFILSPGQKIFNNEYPSYTSKVLHDV
ncbi:Cytokinin dehydrogenase 2 [Linum grandiflorum]